MFFKNFLVPRMPPGEKIHPWIPHMLFNPIFRALERMGVYFYNRVIHRTEMGLYHKLYNPRVHGPYCHFRWYGKPDTPFFDLKLTEVRGWLGRREKTVGAFYNECHRLWYLWAYKALQQGMFLNVVETAFRIIFLWCTLNWFLYQGTWNRETYNLSRVAYYHW